MKARQKVLPSFLMRHNRCRQPDLFGGHPVLADLCQEAFDGGLAKLGDGLFGRDDVVGQEVEPVLVVEAA